MKLRTGDECGCLPCLSAGLFFLPVFEGSSQEMEGLPRGMLWL